MTWARTLGSKYRDGRRNNGGARRGAGRPISNVQRKLIEEYLMQEIVVKEFRYGQMRRVKKRIITAILDQFRNRALKGDVRAAHLYLDMTIGKALSQDSDNKPRYRVRNDLNAIAETGIIK